MRYKSLPLQNDSTPPTKWSEALPKNQADMKGADLLKEYYTVLIEAVKGDPGSFNWIMDVIKRYWLIYFYPKIYSKHVLSADKPFVEKIDPDSAGYHPHCPPLVHVNFNSKY